MDTMMMEKETVLNALKMNAFTVQMENVLNAKNQSLYLKTESAKLVVKSLHTLKIIPASHVENTA